MTEAFKREKVFRDPVHNYIHVNNQVIYDLINTKEFQRLRRIKQLGTSSYTFHGGEHSRFFSLFWVSTKLPVKSLRFLRRNILRNGILTSHY